MNPGYHRSTMKRFGASYFSQRPYCKGCPMIETEFFKALNGSSKSYLNCRMEYGRYVSRQILYHEGNPSTRIYSIKTGFVKTYRTHPLGKDQLIEVAKAGDIINLESLSGGRCTVTAEVLTDSEICFFEVRRLLEMTNSNTPLANTIMRMMSSAVVESQRRILDFGTRDAKSRLAGFLLGMLPSELVANAGKATGRHAARNGTSSPQRSAADFLLPLTRHEIADLIGVRLETISRLFLLFRDKKVVATDRRHVRVLDVRRLRDLAR